MRFTGKQLELVKALDSKSRDPMFKTPGWLQGWFSFSFS